MGSVLIALDNRAQGIYSEEVTAHTIVDLIRAGAGACPYRGHNNTFDILDVLEQYPSLVEAITQAEGRNEKENQNLANAREFFARKSAGQAGNAIAVSAGEQPKAPGLGC
jgi:hypothetical protein